MTSFRTNNTKYSPRVYFVICSPISSTQSIHWQIGRKCRLSQKENRCSDFVLVLFHNFHNLFAGILSSLCTLMMSLFAVSDDGDFSPDGKANKEGKKATKLFAITRDTRGIVHWLQSRSQTEDRQYPVGHFEQVHHYFCNKAAFSY